MIKAKNKMLIILLTFILLIFFPKIVNAKYLNISAPSSGTPGSTVNVTISTDCTGRFNVSVANGTLNGNNKYWLENSSVTISVKLGTSGNTTINVLPANPVSLNRQDIELAAQSKNISINNNTSSGGTSSGPNSGSSNTGSSTSSGAELSMITTSPVDFKGFKSASSGPYYVTVENSVTKIGVSAKSKNGSTYTVSGNTDLQVGTNKVTVTAKKGSSTKQYYIYVTRKASNDEKITPNQIDKEDNQNKDEEKKQLRLSNIVLDDKLNIKLDPNFDPEIFEYTVILGEDYLDLEEILINAIANIEEAKVTIKGNENLVDGENIITITVEAKDYETVTYTIKVMKQKIVETVSKPVLEVKEDQLDNSNKLLKKKIVICSLTSLIALIGIISIAKQCYESTNYKKDYIEEDEEYLPSNQIIHNNYDNNKKLLQEDNEDNILEDIYTKNHFKDTQEENSLGEEKIVKQEKENKKDDTSTDKVSLDEFFNTKMNFYEGKPSRRRGKGKHS